MIPNFICFAVPDDILRKEPVILLTDGIESVAQVSFVTAICFIQCKTVIRYLVREF